MDSQRLFPGCSKHRYKPLRTDDSFRLLRVHAGEGKHVICELIDMSIDNCDIEYEAVSYTWGQHPDSDKVLFTKQGTATDNPTYIGTNLNLSLILRDLRLTDQDRILWIDALCIDQSNVLERNIQVQRMGDIFRNARRVLFCVGRPTDITDVLFAVASRIQQHAGHAGPGFLQHNLAESMSELWVELQHDYFGLLPRMYEGINYIFSQPWFLRVWIIQEVFNAQDAVLHCGQSSMPSSLFVDLLQVLAYVPHPHCNKIVQMMPSTRRVAVRQSLHSLVVDLALCEASDKRDKIFALLDICSDPNAKRYLVPDYTKSEHAVMRELAGYLCDCTISERIPLEWSGVEEFIHSQHGCYYKLYYDVLWHLIAAEDDLNAYVVLQHHGKSITIDRDLITVAVQGKVPQALGWLLADDRCNGLLRSLDWTLNSSTLEAAILNRHEEFLCRLSDLDIWPSNFAILADEPAVSLGFRPIDTTAIRPGVFFLNQKLAIAAAFGFQNLARHLVQSRSSESPEIIDTGKHFLQDSPAHLAACRGHNSILTILFDGGFDTEARTVEGWPVLHCAIVNNREQTVQLLLERGAKTNSRYSFHSMRCFKWTMAHAATTLDGSTILEILQDHGSDLNATACGDLMSPLDVAIGHGNLETVSFLLERNAGITAMTTLLAVDSTNLMVRSCSTQIRKKAAQGADRYATEETSSYKVLKLLLDKNVNMGEQTKGIPSAMVLAAVSANHALELLRMMYEAGVKFDSADGSYALYMAKAFGRLESERELIGYGAKHASEEIMLRFELEAHLHARFFPLIKLENDLCLSYGIGLLFDVQYNLHFHNIGAFSHRYLERNRVLKRMRENGRPHYNLDTQLAALQASLWAVQLETLKSALGSNLN